ncbi:hypothetical protein Bbelb_358160 [Branchiostoma belcheri]|nr:hypothetical protein Bbelb_358160 [Branchiostoma belcheri]
MFPRFPLPGGSERCINRDRLVASTAVAAPPLTVLVKVYTPYSSKVGRPSVVSRTALGGQIHDCKVSGQTFYASADSDFAYTCQAASSVAPPTIQATFGDYIHARSGQTFQLDCIAEGNPKPAVMWRRKGTEEYFKNPLAFSKVEYTAEGAYECVASSPHFPEAIKETYIDVKGKPEVDLEGPQTVRADYLGKPEVDLEGPQTVRAREGSTVSLTCRVTADPPTDYPAWFANGREVSPEDNGLQGWEVIYETDQGKTRTTLFFGNVTSRHAAVYTCRATNKFGYGQKTFDMRIQDRSDELTVPLCQDRSKRCDELTVPLCQDRSKRCDELTVPLCQDRSKRCDELTVPLCQDRSRKCDDLTVPLCQDRSRKCDDLTVPLCQGLDYNSTRLPNALGHATQEQVAREAHQFWPLVEIECSPFFRSFLCSVFAPPCHEDSPDAVPPCKEMCESSYSSCAEILRQYGLSWPDSMNCSQFPSYYGDQELTHPEVHTASEFMDFSYRQRINDRVHEERMFHLGSPAAIGTERVFHFGPPIVIGTELEFHLRPPMVIGTERVFHLGSHIVIGTERVFHLGSLIVIGTERVFHLGSLIVIGTERSVFHLGCDLRELVDSIVLILFCCSVGRALPTCEQLVDCNLDCEYGPKFDENQCPICECGDNPCKETSCGEYEVCALQPIQCLSPPCSPLPYCKPVPFSTNAERQSIYWLDLEPSSKGLDSVDQLERFLQMLEEHNATILHAMKSYDLIDCRMSLSGVTKCKKRNISVVTMYQAPVSNSATSPDLAPGPSSAKADAVVRVNSSSTADVVTVLCSGLVSSSSIFPLKLAPLTSPTVVLVQVNSASTVDVVTAQDQSGERLMVSVRSFLMVPYEDYWREVFGFRDQPLEDDADHEELISTSTDTETAWYYFVDFILKRTGEKTFILKRTGEKTFLLKRTGEKTFLKRTGEKTFLKRTGEKTFLKRTGEKTFLKRTGEKTFLKRTGEKTFILKRTGEKTFLKRTGEKTFLKRTGEKTFLKRTGEKTFLKRTGEKTFLKRTDMPSSLSLGPAACCVFNVRTACLTSGRRV